MSRTFGVILLAIYLIVVGVLAVTNLQIEFAGFVVGGLAIAAAICLLLNK